MTSTSEGPATMVEHQWFYEEFSVLIGKTPMVYLNNIIKCSVANIAAKLEIMEPCCSVKDRIGYSMIADAEQKGLITPGKSILVEPTSGNTGIGLAFIAASKGYKLILTMPASMSLERRVLFESIWCGSCIHYETLVLRSGRTQEARLISLWLELGLEEQYQGLAGILNRKSQALRLLVLSLWKAAYSQGGKPGPHKIQGIVTGFVPTNLDQDVMDEVIQISSDEVVETAKQLALQEGFLVGISSEAAAAAAIKVAQRPETAGKLIAVIFPSFGERYLSSVLFQSIREECEKMQPEP
ncbi:Pyridoxal-phosphate dependent enzyme [Dillenia turbinata]|uniref:Pyridoxal-phosphate dependent enzyme n=1 Tax=Dillenia turbinata TaxID=194707 RepID=A0AAN8UKJ7_9MAGN